MTQHLIFNDIDEPGLHTIEVYRRRGGVFKQLTTDHTWERSDMRHVLKRAVGLDSHLVADYTDGELIPGDVFLMASDGIWEVLGERIIREIMEGGTSTQSIAGELKKHASEELDHAIQIAKQIDYFNGTPVTVPGLTSIARPVGRWS